MDEFDHLWIWDDPATASSLGWYRAVAANRKPAKFRIAGAIPVALSLADATLLAEDLGNGPSGTQDEAGRAAVELQGAEGSWEGILRRYEPVDPATQTVKAVVVVEKF